MMKVGITGGIGSGKSTVCRLFEQRGVAVFYSDVEAKHLMNGELRTAIEARFGALSYKEGMLDRAYLAAQAFSDAQALSDLNAIVHPAVMAAFARWCERQQGAYVILESAILFEAGLEGCVNKTVAVLAPQAVRVERTCLRDKCSPESILQRMAAQSSDEELALRADYTIVNLFEEDLEPAVVRLDRTFSHEAINY